VKPYYEHAGVTIYHGDCREILPQLPEASVDLLLTDPPYGIGYVSRSKTRAKQIGGPMQGDESLNTLRDAVPMLDRLLKNDRHVYAFAAASKIGETADILVDFWRFKNVLVWDKGNVGSIGDLDAGYGVNWEAIVYVMKGRRALFGPRPRSIYRYDWSGTRDPVHPTVKPVGLLRWLIAKSSLPGELVLDPFMGSGTTLRAAKDLGRPAIGIELEEKYCEVAARRLAQETLEGMGE
jgi:site-specific DNA-methyltransferase (adenine-specific)